MTDLRQAAQQLIDRIDREGASPMDWREYYALEDALEQQAEPICPECKAAVLYECVACSSNNYPPQQQAKMRLPKVGDRVTCLEDESLGEVVSLTAGGSPDIKFDDGSRGTYLLREFAELFGYVTPPKRQWVGLTDEEATKIWESTDDKDSWELLKRVEAKLKEKNSDQRY